MSLAEKKYAFEGSKGIWTVFASLCKGCGLCKEKCPKNCLSWASNLGVYGTPLVEPHMDNCTACGICQTVCPDCAITVAKIKKQ